MCAQHLSAPVLSPVKGCDPSSAYAAGTSMMLLSLRQSRGGERSASPGV
jgi:hypothetical protein